MQGGEKLWKFWTLKVFMRISTPMEPESNFITWCPARFMEVDLSKLASNQHHQDWDLGWMRADNTRQGDKCYTSMRDVFVLQLTPNNSSLVMILDGLGVFGKPQTWGFWRSCANRSSMGLISTKCRTLSLSLRATSSVEGLSSWRRDFTSTTLWRYTC